MADKKCSASLVAPSTPSPLLACLNCKRRLQKRRSEELSPRHFDLLSPRRFVSEAVLWHESQDATPEAASTTPNKSEEQTPGPPPCSPRQSPSDCVILRSDSQTYLNAEQRKPKALPPCCGENNGLASRVLTRKRSRSWIDELETVHIARRHSMKDLIPNCEDDVVVRLTAILANWGMWGKWRIPCAEREKLEQQLDVDTDTLMRKFVVVAQHLSKPVVSVFHVGSAGLGASGDVYLGANVEFSSGEHATNVCGFHYTLHGEQSVTINMFLNDEKAMRSLYISHMPCGMCRQFLAELPGYRDIKVWTPQLGTVTTLGELLPHSFGPTDLGMSSTAIPWGEPNPVTLAATSQAKALDPEITAAVELAAQRAHAPYTSSFAGVVIRTKSGQLCSGSCIESVAFNPSVSPMQMALLSLWMKGGQVQDIANACLAEDPSSPISYRRSDAALLTAVAPWATLWLIPLQSMPDLEL